ILGFPPLEDLTGLSFWMFCSSTECKGEEKVTQPPGDVILTQGQTATLKCTFSNYFFWYKQDPGKAPEFLIYHRGSGSLVEAAVDGLKINVKTNQLQMIISSAALSHSAVYYCAVRPTVTANTQSLYNNLTAAHSH
uniref:Ig-like domain-containing protein n=1 Tax=Gouania willdenowi TaxID=441366 RepID=A0A8C5GNF3_GOUWI